MCDCSTNWDRTNNFLYLCKLKWYWGTAPLLQRKVVLSRYLHPSLVPVVSVSTQSPCAGCVVSTVHYLLYTIYTIYRGGLGHSDPRSVESWPTCREEGRWPAWHRDLVTQQHVTRDKLEQLVKISTVRCDPRPGAAAAWWPPRGWWRPRAEARSAGRTSAAASSPSQTRTGTAWCGGQ